MYNEQSQRHPGSVHAKERLFYLCSISVSWHYTIEFISRSLYKSQVNILLSNCKQFIAMTLYVNLNFIATTLQCLISTCFYNKWFLSEQQFGKT